MATSADKTVVPVSWNSPLISVNDIGELWKAQPTYIISQSVFILAGIVTLIHAFRKGGRWPYFWLTTVLHGLFSDNFWHIVVPEYDNFWHSQTPIIFFGKRLPLHIILLYPAFIYHAAYAVSKLNLPRYAQPFAVGLVTVLIDIPYDIVAVKFVHWTWHDTDPNIYDRHYWVPWNSYYFHSTFAASLYFFFTFSKQWISRWRLTEKKTEWISVLISSLMGMPGGVLLFIPIYHPLHDLYNVHSEVTVFAIFAIYFTIIFSGLLQEREKITQRLTTIDYILILQLALHYLIYWIFVVFFDPEKERSLGLHEPVGPCNERATLVSPIGLTLSKRKYFCPDNYNEDYFDFHCVGGQKPPNGSNWYLICGTPFENRVEYILVLSTILLTATGVFYGLYFKTINKPLAKKMKIK